MNRGRRKRREKEKKKRRERGEGGREREEEGKRGRGRGRVSFWKCSLYIICREGKKKGGGERPRSGNNLSCVWLCSLCTDFAFNCSGVFLM